MARRKDIVLTQGLICQASMELIEEEGLDALTMRSVASRLKVQAPSLYAHYRDKSELMTDLAASYFIEARDAVYDWQSPKDWLCQFGFAFYNVLKTRRDAARLFAQSQPPVQSGELSAEAAVRPLTDAGIGMSQAVELQGAVIALAVGMALDHGNPVTRDYLARYFNLEQALKSAIAALVTGLLSHLGTRTPSAPFQSAGR